MEAAGVTAMPAPRQAEHEAAAPGFIDRTAKREYLRLALGCFFVSFTSAHMSLLAIVFERDGYDLHAIGLLLSLIAIPIIGFSLVSGEVMARIGALDTLRLAMLLTIVGFGSLLITRHTFASALASRMVQGVGLGFYLAAAYTYIQSRLDQTRFLFLLGVFSAMMPLSQAVAPPFGGYVMAQWGESALFVCAVVPGIVGLLLTFGVRPLPRPKTSGLQLRAGLRPGVWEPLLAVFVNGTMWGFCAAYLAAALVAKGIPLAAFFTASLTTMFASRLLALRSVEHANRRLLIATGLALMAAGLGAVAMAGVAMWPVIAGGICFGFGYSLTYPVIAAWIGDGQDASDRAGSQALLNAAFNFGLFAMPLPETWLLAVLGYDGTLVVLAALGFTMAVVLTLRAGRPASIHARFK